jgi:two-component system response regulator DctR
VRKIRELDGAVSILVLTVDERQEIAEKFMIAGATDFAIKPIKAPDLISRMKVNLEITEIQRKRIKNKQQIMVDKGISTATLNIIHRFLKKHHEPLTIDEITAGVGLAYQTVHRYLQYLVGEGRVMVIPEYGKIGRPKNKYKLR